jgi:hypothetical protein
MIATDAPGGRAPESSGHPGGRDPPSCPGRGRPGGGEECPGQDPGPPNTPSTSHGSAEPAPPGTKEAPCRARGSRGGQGRHRSGDLRFFRPALSQLSYLTRRRRGGALAGATGFEPATSGLTGRRELRASPRPRAPNGIRTRVTGLKGRRPGPLDDGGGRPSIVSTRRPAVRRREYRATPESGADRGGYSCVPNPDTGRRTGSVTR